MGIIRLVFRGFSFVGYKAFGGRPRKACLCKDVFVRALERLVSSSKGISEGPNERGHLRLDTARGQCPFGWAQAMSFRDEKSCAGMKRYCAS